MESDRTLFVLLMGWPGNHRGYSLAVRSSLAAYATVYERVEALVLAYEEQAPPPLPGNVALTWQRITRHSVWRRALRSAVSPYPPFTRQFLARDTQRRVAAFLARDERADVVIEGLPLMVYTFTMPGVFANRRVAFRSHDVTAKAFAPMAAGGGLMTLYWKREVPRIRAFEREAAARAGVLWSISSSDDAAWRSLHGLTPDGLLGVGIELERYHAVPAGPPHSVLHIGYLDARKGDAVRRFAREVWPPVRRRVPDAELVLAGRGSEQVNDPALGIRGLGPVDDDAGFLAAGPIFVNPQVAGSGIKLKSIIAMAAGKALVGTPNAVEGIDGEDGRDFVVADGSGDYADKLASLLESPERAAAIGAAARRRAEAQFSQAQAEARARDVIARWHEGGSA